MTSPSANSSRSLTLLAVAMLLPATRLLAQTLPPTTPTTAPAAPATPPPPPARRAQVDFTSHLLTVTADNSSLNQILRDISRATGMTITGGVTDEKVFGTYGPADPSTVLSALLNGTGSNMLLILDAAKSPRELILTARQGGVTPPSPNSYRNDDNDLSPQGYNRFGKQPSMMQPPPPPQPPPQQPPPPQAQPQYPQTPAVNVDNPAPTPPAADTTQQSPNGVKTPQQIYEELMKMQKAPATPPPPQ